MIIGGSLADLSGPAAAKSFEVTVGCDYGRVFLWNAEDRRSAMEIRGNTLMVNGPRDEGHLWVNGVAVSMVPIHDLWSVGGNPSLAIGGDYILNARPSAPALEARLGTITLNAAPAEGWLKIGGQAVGSPLLSGTFGLGPQPPPGSGLLETKAGSSLVIWNQPALDAGALIFHGGPSSTFTLHTNRLSNCGPERADDGFRPGCLYEFYIGLRGAGDRIVSRSEVESYVASSYPSFSAEEMAGHWKGGQEPSLRITMAQSSSCSINSWSAGQLATELATRFGQEDVMVIEFEVRIGHFRPLN